MAKINTNLLLIMLLVMTALSLVNSNHQARKLKTAIEHESIRSKALDNESRHLQIEYSRLTSQPRVQTMAQKELGMNIAPMVITVLPIQSLQKRELVLLNTPHLASVNSSGFAQ